MSYTTFHSTGTRNLTGFTSPAVDDLLEKARRAQTVAERKRFYGDFQRIVAEETPYCLLSITSSAGTPSGKEYRGFEYLGVSVGVIQSLRKAWLAK